MSYSWIQTPNLHNHTVRHFPFNIQ
jgi:hypothetical protein